MKQTDWKIIYSSYKGVSKRTVQFLSKEVGKYLIRETNVYRIYVLPCEKEGCEVSKNAFFVGLYDESTEMQKFVKREEVPENGFLVKVVKNPSDEEGRFVLITSCNEQELFYGAVHFIDDYIPSYCKKHGANPMPDLIFDSPLQVYSYSEITDNKTRSIFTWGHSISDYRSYIDNMARAKFNELVLWNDFVPLNIDEIIDYAHSYGIKVILGYSWGWNEMLKNRAEPFSVVSFEKIKENVVEEYIKNYKQIDCDGIYFQSFTERNDEYINGKSVAALVTDMVNDVADKLWQITPGLRLIFGLHATSVKNHLEEIANVNSEIEILWEDCGEFPYNYNSSVSDIGEFEKTLEFTDKLLKLRGGKGVGLVLKGVMMLDWNRFVHQSGPFVMGNNTKEIIIHDKNMRANSWRIYSADWLQSGEDTLRLIRYIKDNKTDDVNMCIAGTFDGGSYLPFSLCAEMFRNSGREYGEILNKVSKRANITVD